VVHLSLLTTVAVGYVAHTWFSYSIVTHTCIQMFTGIVFVIAIIYGSVESHCITQIIQPSTGIANGVEINDNVEINCKCDTNTIQLESWYFKGSIITLIQSNHLPYATILPDGYVTLTIPDFTPSFAGNYTCASSNNGLSTQVELTISKQCKSLLALQWPLVLLFCRLNTLHFVLDSPLVCVT